MAFYFFVFLFVFYKHCYGQPNVVYVDPNGPCINCDGSKGKPFKTIQNALDSNKENKDIRLNSGTYTGNGNINLTINSDVTIIHANNGDDYKNTIIDCDNNGFGFIINANGITLQQITIKNCVATKHKSSKIYNDYTLGGAIFIDANGNGMHLDHCYIMNNVCNYDGAG